MLDYQANRNLGATAAPRRILSVTGGGLLGVIPAAMLCRYEQLGRETYGPNYRLSDSFDLVGGTSTGAVIATGVALGLDAHDIAGFYLRDVPQGFRRRIGRIIGIHDLFDGDLMERFFVGRTGQRVLDRRDLECHLMITAKDVTRGRALAFTTLTAINGQVLGAEIRHDKIALSRLLRASTAAPGLFSPVALTLEVVGDITVVDGGISPFNDPGLLLAQGVWQGGNDRIALTSLGTGRWRTHHCNKRLTGGPSILRATRSLQGIIKSNDDLTRELLAEIVGGPGGALTVRRHDMDLEAKTFELLGLSVSTKEIKEMRQIANVAGKERLFEAALLYANQTISQPLELATSGPLETKFDSHHMACPNAHANF